MYPYVFGNRCLQQRCKVFIQSIKSWSIFAQCLEYIVIFCHNYFFTLAAVIRSVLNFFITIQHQIFVSKKQHDN